MIDVGGFTDGIETHVAISNLLAKKQSNAKFSSRKGFWLLRHFLIFKSESFLSSPIKIIENDIR